MENEGLKRIYLLLGLAITIISFSSIIIKLSTAPSLIIAFYRLFFTTIIMTPYFVIKHRRKVKIFLDYRLVIVGFLLALHFIFWITSLEYTSVANSVIFVSMQPLFSLILEALFAREDLRKGIFLGVLFALLGTVIIGIADFSFLLDKIWGDFLALIAGLFVSAYLFIGRSLREKLDYFPYIYTIYTYAAIFLGVFTIFSSHEFGDFEPINYLYFLGLAIGPNLIGHSILNYSVRYLPTTIVSLAFLAEPILSSTWAFIFLGEKITIITVGGGMLILLGIYHSTVRKNKDLNGIQKGY
jgi:drug/metabolite transporter (DMT)-like permease